MRITKENAWGMMSLVVSIGALVGSMIAWRYAAASAQDADEARWRAESLETRMREMIRNEHRLADSIERTNRLMMEDPEPARAPRRVELIQPRAPRDDF